MSTSFRIFPLFTRAVAVGAGALALLSCNPDDDSQSTPLYNLSKDGSNVLVLNEGQFGTPNGEISLFSKTTKKILNNNAFRTINQRDIGDVIQSMLVVGDRGYIVVNNSKKVEVIDVRTFGEVATVDGLDQPRYAVAAGPDKVYISEWTSGTTGRVAVLDTRTNKVSKTVPVGGRPEQMLLAGGKVYVPNSDQNTVTVINASTDAVESTLTVTEGPSALVQDASGAIWVSCSGITRYGGPPSYAVISSTPGSLIKLNAAASAAALTLPFTRSGPANLQLNAAGTELYYRYSGGVYRMSTTASTLPTTPIIRRSFYGFNVDPQDNTIYGAIAPYTTTGKFIRYQASGTAIDSFNVGLLPNGFVFY
ncbi:hypothetical protein MTX78_19665 [Hymenobacter tibetensis]|uniref:Cell surface protein n=1 Tax=Hymenobacter tibetensis TaxID=497967 RepID=A0ABY4CZB9_9BACT|nr:DUF5074 domain-containing protein [Hymenobacter tibetensis]UOG74324.1 hypothetical protein MTX78_19665 [Hymenobacter tibetensis]